MEKIFRDIKEFVLNNKLVSLLFVVSTVFFLAQHNLSLAWDFQAYVINARYWFYGGSYFEVYRAPLISILLGVFLVFAKFGEYIYILFVSALFLYSIERLSNALYKKYFYKYYIEKELVILLFYLFSLNVFLLNHGLSNGTELLALSFFQLFLANFMLDKNSGHWLGLAFLSRYNFMLFGVFLFFNKDIKKILKNMGLFLCVCFPWFLYNFLKWGNWFASIADSYYLNVVSRMSLFEPFLFSHLLHVINWFFPFFIIGLVMPLVYKKYNNWKYYLLFVLISLIFLYDFYNIPFKIIRYAFNFVLPVAFFSTIGFFILIKNIKIKNFEKVLIAILLLILFINLAGLLIDYNKYKNYNQIYANASQDIVNLGLENCKILSAHWVILNYYTENAYFLSYGIDDAISKNEIVLLFYNCPTFDDNYNLSELTKYHKLILAEDYLILAKEGLTNETCAKWKGHDSLRINEPCGVLAKKFGKLNKIVEKSCDFVNFK